MGIVIDYYGNRFEEETLFDPQVMSQFIIGEWYEGGMGGEIRAMTDDQLMQYLAGVNMNRACHDWCMPQPMIF